MKKLLKKISTSFFILIVFLLGTPFLFAATTGVIDPANDGSHFAKLVTDPGSGATAINFGKYSDPAVSASNISITDSGFSGYAWSSTAGWISLWCGNATPNNCGTNGNFRVLVANDGTLSGYAWGAGTGWINFGPFQSGAAQVKIGSDGKFAGTSGTAGYAWSQNYGWIIFDCTDSTSCVKTDYTPSAYRVTTPTGGTTGGGPNPSTPIPPATENPPVTPPVIIPPAENPPPTETPPVTSPTETTPSEETTPPASSDNPSNSNPDTSSPGSGQTTTPGGGGGFFGGGSDPIIPAARAAVAALQKAVTTSAEALATPVGKALSKTVSTVGLALAPLIAIAAAAAETPVLFADIALLPLRLWSLLLVSFGIRRKKSWGTVFDSQTKQPIDPAYVMVVDSAGNEVGSAITDIDGRYGFLLAPGTYVMNASKTHYQFPSKLLAGKQSDELYGNLYFGEPIAVTHQDEVAIKNIPLDPIGFDWNEFAKQKQGLTRFFLHHDILIKRLTTLLFDIGFFLAFVTLIITPSVFNVVIFVLYIVMALLRTTGILGEQTSRVFDTEGETVSFALVEVFNATAKQRVARKVTSVYGRFFCLIPKGLYYMTVSYKNLNSDGYTLAYTSESFYVRNGHITKRIIIPVKKPELPKAPEPVIAPIVPPSSPVPPPNLPI